jgi:hypothetical protein
MRKVKPLKWEGENAVAPQSRGRGVAMDAWKSTEKNEMAATCLVQHRPSGNNSQVKEKGENQIIVTERRAKTETTCHDASNDR